MTGRRVVAGALLGSVLGGAFALAGGPALAARADVVDDGAPGRLVVAIEPGGFDLELAPGDSAWWAITPGLDAATSTDGTLSLDVEATGALATDPGGLRFRIRECGVAWSLPADRFSAAACSGAESILVAERPFAGGADALALGDLAAGAQRHLLLDVRLPDPAPSRLQGHSGDFALGFAAAGDAESIGGDGAGSSGGDLAFTGVALLAPVALAVVLAMTGAMLRGTGSGRRRGSGSR